MNSGTNHGVALVTNVDSDIGLAVARSLVATGYSKIMLAAKSSSGVRKAYEALLQQPTSRSVQFETHAYSTQKYEDIEQLISQTLHLLGGLDVAINCLSMSPVAACPTAETEAKQYKAGLSAGSREIWLLCKAQSTYFISQQERQNEKAGALGQSIVNIVPFGNLGVVYSHSIQAASSYSAIGITKSLARDVKPYGIRVNAVCPGMTEGKEDMREDSMDIPAKGNKAGDRLVSVNEVANVASFVAGPGGSGMTGAVVPVDFGWSLTHS